MHSVLFLARKWVLAKANGTESQATTTTIYLVIR